MKNIRIILISAIMLLSIFLISAVAQDGFDEWGFNLTARIFNGLLGNADMDMDGDSDLYGGSPTFPPESLYPLEYTDADGNSRAVLIDVAGAQGVGKWSKGFSIGGTDEMGAWQGFHIEGTGKIYNPDTDVTIYEGHLIIFYRMQLERVAGERQYVMTQLVINGQGVVAKEIPPGFGVRIPKVEEPEEPVP